MAVPTRKVSADDSAAPVEAVQVTKPQLDVIPANKDYKRLFSDAAFMEEKILILLHQSSDLSETGIPVSVSGDRVYITPGRPTHVKRKHVAQLIKARPDIITHRSDDPATPERHLNRMYRQSTSRYNFDVLEDTAQGASWIRELRSQHIRR